MRRMKTDVEGAASAGATHEVVLRLYEKRKEIYPRARIGNSLGWFQKWRWAVIWLTQIVFYGLPWLVWNGRQAVLFDLGARKFYIFGLVLWPQDVIYLAALLIISALSLFLFTAVAGRLWCGYACPQTVYTEIFMWIERQFEGDRAKRMALDRAPWSAGKVVRKGAKHAAWIAVALWTGFTFVGFFTPIRELGTAVLTLSTGPWESFWILFYGFATYGNAGWLREQVCKYMCPYARFQSAMFDSDTLVVTYDRERGEPRGARQQEQGPHGPRPRLLRRLRTVRAGVSDRHRHPQRAAVRVHRLRACIDACDHVMDRTSQPRGLIRYSTENGLAQHLTLRQMWQHVARPRVLIYTAILGAVVVGTVTALALRVPLKVDIIRDRGALAREVEDGRVENVYRLQVMNTTEAPQRYEVSAAGLPGLTIASDKQFELGAGEHAHRGVAPAGRCRRAAGRAARDHRRTLDRRRGVAGAREDDLPRPAALSGSQANGAA